MLSPLVKKVLLFGGGFWLLCFALSEFTQYWQRKDTPPFLLQMWDYLPENPRMVARLGENALPQYSYNVYEAEGDSLPYSFSLDGEKGSLQIKGYALKRRGQWVLIKADTLFTPAQ